MNTGAGGQVGQVVAERNRYAPTSSSPTPQPDMKGVDIQLQRAFDAVAYRVQLQERLAFFSDTLLGTERESNAAPQQPPQTVVAGRPPVAERIDILVMCLTESNRQLEHQLDRLQKYV